MHRFFGRKCVTFIVRYQRKRTDGTDQGISHPNSTLHNHGFMNTRASFLTLVSASPREIARCTDAVDASRSRELCVHTQS